MLTGLAAGLGGAALTLLLHGVQHAAYGYSEQTFLVGVERASGQRRVLVMALAGVVAGVGWLALRGLAAPLPRVSDAVRTRGVLLPLLPVAVDAGLQVVVVALGASLGREGAPRQLGAALGAWTADRAGLAPQDRRVLLACGAGAGLAAVYDVPVAGTLFVLEALLGTAAPAVAVQAAVACAVASGVALLVVPDLPSYDLPHLHLSAGLVGWALVAGPLLGAAAHGFTTLTDAAARRRPAGWRLPVATTVVFTLVGVAATAYPALLGNGKGAAQLAFSGGLPWTELLALAVLKPLATAACLGSGARGGRLTPALATGALLGALGGGGTFGGGAEHAFVAAAAFLAVTLGAPLTAVALLLELTGTGGALLLPAMVATGGAVLTARVLQRRGHR